MTLVAEHLQLVDEVASPATLVDSVGVEVGAEVVEPGGRVGQEVPHDDQDGPGHGDQGLELAAALDQAPVTIAEEGVGLGRGGGRLAEDALEVWVALAGLASSALGPGLDGAPCRPELPAHHLPARGDRPRRLVGAGEDPDPRRRRCNSPALRLGDDASALGCPRMRVQLRKDDGRPPPGGARVPAAPWRRPGRDGGGQRLLDRRIRRRPKRDLAPGGLRALRASRDEAHRAGSGKARVQGPGGAEERLLGAIVPAASGVRRPGRPAVPARCLGGFQADWRAGDANEQARPVVALGCVPYTPGTEGEYPPRGSSTPRPQVR